MNVQVHYSCLINKFILIINLQQKFNYLIFKIFQLQQQLFSIFYRAIPFYEISKNFFYDTAILFDDNIQQFSKIQIYKFYLQQDELRNLKLFSFSLINDQKKKNNKYEVAQLDQILEKLVKAKILITISKDNEINYSQDGVILRNEQSQGASQDFDLLVNREQILNLYWQGKYDQNQLKIGKWTAAWNGQYLYLIGGYYQNGLKQGLWGELFLNYRSQAQVYEIGEYVQDRKFGKWIYIYDNEKIIGGSYNEQGLKNGQWNELNHGFMNESQVIYNGEYKNGNKIGMWNILYRWNMNQPFKIMQNYYKKVNFSGGGQYDYIDSIKIGIWIELCDNLFNRSLVVQHGQYKFGQKIGRWDIFYVGDKIGGGLYDEVNYGFKIGRWIELRILKSHIVVNIKTIKKLVDGIFYLRGIIYTQNMKNCNNYNAINFSGGGQYDEKSSVKFGSWIELSDGFGRNSKIIYTGEYKNDQKVGRWDIQYKEADKEQLLLIGGGQYDKMGNGSKIGRWIEISDGFSDDSKLTYKGDYKNGQKVGIWESFWNWVGNKKIAGGSYDEKDSIKVGRWIELRDGFGLYEQVIYNGEYKNGKKVGRWDILYRQKGMEQFQQIGWQQYDEGGDSIKIGRQIELWDKFNDHSQVYYIGKYKYGRKVGRWDIYLKSDWKVQQIGGGSYDEKGEGIKIGMWSELHEGFRNSNQRLQNGEYKNGKKVGTWTQINLRKN
ncbi:unnamed protein product [Paramecium primaurelia]|uniref:Uncharacterized protein n=1 Tax=Paramecium primaurelia TaxID=5886 RepID=A0A8S1QST0_PARPR|nr:unnamed protein product [Paramecium primaurelia]